MKIILSSILYGILFAKTFACKDTADEILAIHVNGKFYYNGFGIRPSPMRAQELDCCVATPPSDSRSWYFFTCEGALTCDYSTQHFTKKAGNIEYGTCMKGKGQTTHVSTSYGRMEGGYAGGAVSYDPYPNNADQHGYSDAWANDQQYAADQPTYRQPEPYSVSGPDRLAVVPAFDYGAQSASTKTRKQKKDRRSSHEASDHRTASASTNTDRRMVVDGYNYADEASDNGHTYGDDDKQIVLMDTVQKSTGKKGKPVKSSNKEKQQVLLLDNKPASRSGRFSRLTSGLAKAMLPGRSKL